jgi:hypothetical protein
MTEDQETSSRPQVSPLFKIRATKGDSMTTRFRSCALITLLSAGVSAGYSLAGTLYGPFAFAVLNALAVGWLLKPAA